MIKNIPPPKKKFFLLQKKTFYPPPQKKNKNPSQNKRSPEARRAAIKINPKLALFFQGGE